MSSGHEDQGLVLRQLPYSDNASLVDFLMLERGLTRLIVPGQRRKRSRGHALQPFKQSWLRFGGRGALKTLYEYESKAPDFSHRLQARRLICAFYVNELLYRLLPQEEAQPEIYTLYLNVLEALCDQSESQVLRQFEIQLLTHLGLLPELTHVAQTGELVEADINYQFVVDSGVEHWGSNNAGLFVKGATLLALAQRQALDDQQLREARRLTRGLIDYHLSGKALHSRQLLR